MRVHLLIAGLLVVFVSACGDSSAGGESATSAGANAADSTLEITSTTSEVASPSGLRCPDDMFEMGSIDYVGGTVGFDSPIQAAASWFGVDSDDPGLASKPDRAGSVLILYTPTWSEGPAAAITVADYGSGWLVESTETCALSKYSRPAN